MTVTVTYSNADVAEAGNMITDAEQATRASSTEEAANSHRSLSTTETFTVCSGHAPTLCDPVVLNIPHSCSYICMTPMAMAGMGPLT